ncbi:MAG: GNAT family N-acetyltransferase [Myxococcota bacterium]|nr:GNAT family N-acetyltransferase [Myxococcota bacterium]
MSHDLSIRPLDGSKADYERFSTLYKATELHGVADAEQRMKRDAMRREIGGVIDYWLAEQEGELVGIGTSFTLLRYAAPGRRFVELGVRPDKERMGIGRRLWGAMLEDLRRDGVTELIGTVCDHRPNALPFALDAGFECIAGEVDHELRIDLSTQDLDALQPLVDRVAGEGIRLAGLTTLKAEVPDWFDRLYTLWTTCDSQIPTTLSHTTPTPEAFRTTELEGPNTLDDAYFIALDGDAWVGLSELRSNEGAEWPIFPGLTGVLPSHRGRGIATALKVLGLRWAKGAGHQRLQTHNAESNPGMRAVNERLGFRRCASWHSVRRRL